MRALVIEDHPRMSALLRQGLEEEGYAVDAARSLLDGMSLAGEFEFDAIVLDVMLPDGDGIDALRELRDKGVWSPVLILTAKDAVDDRVRGLDAGADDYLVKPFALDELLARLRAFERRAPSVGQDRGELRFGDLVIDRDAMTCARADHQIPLSRTEYQLLELLMANAGKVLSRDVIFDKVWGYDFGPESNSLDVYVGYLRRKLEADGESRIIHTVRGVGYVMREP